MLNEITNALLADSEIRGDRAAIAKKAIGLLHPNSRVQHLLSFHNRGAQQGATFAEDVEEIVANVAAFDLDAWCSARIWEKVKSSPHGWVVKVKGAGDLAEWLTILADRDPSLDPTNGAVFGGYPSIYEYSTFRLTEPKRNTRDWIFDGWKYQHFHFVLKPTEILRNVFGAPPKKKKQSNTILF